MSLTNVNTYRVEKQYQQYYDNSKLSCLVHNKSKPLRDTYTYAWIKLLTENASKTFK